VQIAVTNHANLSWHKPCFPETGTHPEFWKAKVNMALIEKNGFLLVGYAPIDHDHDEFITLLNQLDAADNGDFPALFQQLLAHTEQHFDRENQLMEQSAFPAETEHKGEHQRVLGEFRQFKKRVDKGLITFGRSLVRERLPQWLELHVRTMDSALAAHIKAQSQA
jgi:hemerythrin